MKSKIQDQTLEGVSSKHYSKAKNSVKTRRPGDSNKRKNTNSSNMDKRMDDRTAALTRTKSTITTDEDGYKIMIRHRKKAPRLSHYLNEFQAGDKKITKKMGGGMSRNSMISDERKQFKLRRMRTRKASSNMLGTDLAQIGENTDELTRSFNEPRSNKIMRGSFVSINVVNDDLPQDSKGKDMQRNKDKIANFADYVKGLQKLEG